MKSNIVVTLNFEGVHLWPGCPHEEVDFLTVHHRHMFYVRATKAVTHDDRDIEIIMFKRQIQRFIKNLFPHKDDCLLMGHTSCEMLCRQLQQEFDLEYVQVLEDNENGAELFKGEEDV